MSNKNSVKKVRFMRELYNLLGTDNLLNHAAQQCPMFEPRDAFALNWIGVAAISTASFSSSTALGMHVQESISRYESFERGTDGGASVTRCIPVSPRVGSSQYSKKRIFFHFGILQRSRSTKGESKEPHQEPYRRRQKGADSGDITADRDSGRWIARSGWVV